MAKSRDAMSGSSGSVAEGPAISEASIELECVDFAVRYKAPGEAEVDDLAGQNVPRGMATRKQRRVQMAKKCRAAARTRGTTREAARAHRLAADELADTCGQLAVTDGVRTWWEAAAEAAAEEAAAAEAAAEEAAAAARRRRRRRQRRGRPAARWM